MFAVVIDHLGPSQKAFYFIENMQKVKDDVVCVSLDNRPQCTDIPFAIISYLEGLNLNCPMVATSPKTLKYVLNHTKCTPYFYMYNLDWQLYQGFHHLLRRASLITRSQSHHDVVKRVLGLDSTIVHDFDLEKIKEIVQ